MSSCSRKQYTHSTDSIQFDHGLFRGCKGSPRVSDLLQEALGDHMNFVINECMLHRSEAFLAKTLLIAPNFKIGQSSIEESKYNSNFRNFHCREYSFYCQFLSFSSPFLLERTYFKAPLIKQNNNKMTTTILEVIYLIPSRCYRKRSKG